MRCRVRKRHRMRPDTWQDWNRTRLYEIHRKNPEARGCCSKRLLLFCSAKRQELYRRQSLLLWKKERSGSMDMLELKGSRLVVHLPE